MNSAPSLLARYQAGEQEVVWHELRQLGRAVRRPEHLAGAEAVCNEFARRCRSNIELIVDRLTAQGYRFHSNNDEKSPLVPLRPPTPEASDLANWLDERFGPIPLTLAAWIRTVGDVWLVGSHPSWPEAAGADPLVVEIELTQYEGADVREHFESEYEQWREDPLGMPFALPVAPDHLHKASISGGAPYAVLLPDECVDAYLVEEMGLPLVSYLRRVFDNGGFFRHVPYPIRQQLSEGLLAI